MNEVQFWHDVAPPVPHAVATCTWQVFPAQHPFGHEAAVHVHAPLVHASPEPQPPHVAPPVPHEPVDWLA
jgi:hypothetical protein